MKYKADVALKRKIVFPLFSTINVCGEKKKRNNQLITTVIHSQAVHENCNLRFCSQIIEDLNGDALTTFVHHSETHLEERKWLPPRL